MYQKYKNFIAKFISLNYVEWLIFQSRLQTVTFKKGDIILNVGDISKHMLFINKGLARASVIDEHGKDYTWSIFFNDKNAKMTNLFVVDYHSFCTQEPSNLEIQAIEECEMFQLKHSDVMFLYDKLKKFERFGRLMGEEAYKHAHKIMINERTKNAQERFEIFMEETPFLLDRVPQYHIATLLDITPQYLSRLKKSMNLCE